MVDQGIEGYGGAHQGLVAQHHPAVALQPVARIASAMASKWDNFLANLGEWRGSFTTITAAGLLQEPSPSVLTLARGEGDGHVVFTLQRWSPGTQVAPGGGPGEGAVEPGRDIQQDYRSLGNQVVFFDSGAFNKGSMQVAPNTVFGGEFGFISGTGATVWCSFIRRRECLTSWC